MIRKQLREALKTYFRCELIKTRNTLGWSQEKMANTLTISTRAYTDIESGRSCCSLSTFLIFLHECCTDRTACIDNLMAFMDTLEDEAQ